jgi:hypothetical protein
MEEMKSALSPYWNRCVFHRLDSVSASKLFPDGFFDFVYIDGDHSEVVIEDVKAWYPKVAPGGMLSGHDWCIVGKYIKDVIPGREIIFETGGVGSPNVDWWMNI